MIALALVAAVLSVSPAIPPVVTVPRGEVPTNVGPLPAAKPKGSP